MRSGISPGISVGKGAAPGNGVASEIPCDFLPQVKGEELAEELRSRETVARHAATWLSARLPRRLAEALLARAGAIPAPGSVERGTTVCDYTPLEKSLQHSLKLAVASFETNGNRIHLLDTPGYPDFLGHSLPALAAVSTAARAGRLWPRKSG